MTGEISYLNVLSDLTYPELKLCRPDYTTIHSLQDIYNLRLKLRMGAINEVSFTIPTMITRQHNLVVNPLINLIKDRYYLKMDFENQVEYFLFLDRDKQLSGDGTTISYTAYGAGIELTDKNIYNHKEDAWTLSQHARSLLSETIWSVDYVDSKFDTKYRTFEVSSSTVSNAIFELANTYNAVATFDSINRKVSFYDSNNIGMNRGLELREGYLLDSLSVSTRASDMVTRLKVYGQDGLEFRTLSPTGSNYIEDFSYFMYPFECDANYNVLKHSDHMSDSLCIAILKYKKKILDYQGLFDNLVIQRTSKQNEIQQEEQNLSTLNTQLITLEDEQWLINREYQDDAPNRADWIDVTNRINTKKNEIDNKTYLINNLKSQLNNITSQINNIATELKTENNFTQSELVELNKFTLVDEYTNESIVDEKDLWEEAQEIFDTYNEPPINVSVGMEGYIDSFRDRLKPKRLSIGDILNVESEELQVKLKLRTIGIEIDFDNSNVDIEIANGKDIIDEDAKFRKFIADASSTSTTVNMEKYIYRQGKDAMDEVTQILNSEYDTAKNMLKGGYNGTTVINERGLFSQDYQNSDTYMVINNGILAVTRDNGNSIEVSISSRGVYAEKLVGRAILSNKFMIASDSGIITIEDLTMTIKDNTNKKLVELGRYDSPDNPSVKKHGLRIYDGAIDIRTSSNANRGTQFDADGIRTFNNNGVRTFNLNATTGQVEIIGDLTIKSTATSNRGVEITADGIKGRDASGNITFELNANTGKSTVQQNFIIQTSTNVLEGVKISDYGIKGYNASGVLTFNLDSTNGNAYFKGDINASNITGSHFTAGSIDITTDLYVGSEIYMRGVALNTGLYFSESQNAYIKHQTTVSGSDIVFNRLRIHAGNVAGYIDMYSETRFSDIARFNHHAYFSEDVYFTDEVEFTGHVNFSGINTVIGLENSGYATEQWVIDYVDSHLP